MSAAVALTTVVDTPVLAAQADGDLEMIEFSLQRGILLSLPFAASVLLSGCVSQSKYDELQAQYQQVQQQNAALSNQVAADKAQICRLQGAIRYTVNSDLLFPSGGWQMNDRGKQVIAKLAGKLAEVRGIIFGEMLDCVQNQTDRNKDQGYTLEEVILRVVGGLGVPVAYGLRSGHVSCGNITLPFGVNAALNVTAGGVSLGILEAATTAAVSSRSAG